LQYNTAREGRCRPEAGRPQPARKRL